MGLGLGLGLGLDFGLVFVFVFGFVFGFGLTSVPQKAGFARKRRLVSLLRWAQ